MGVGNIKLVYNRWRPLPNTSFRVLTWMALRSMDSDDPPLFWGGWEELALALGRDLPPRDATDPASTKERNKAYEAVKYAKKVLKRKGAITLVRDAGPGRPAAYALNLSLGMVGTEFSPVEGTQPPSFKPRGRALRGAESPAMEGTQPPAVGGTESGNGGDPAPRLGGQEDSGLISGRDGWGDHQPAGTARARASDEPDLPPAVAEEIRALRAELNRVRHRTHDQERDTR
ncbi:hypothetical protein GCM10010411_67500 [Actinomadura fulvescens]|uniref:Uncharacterized protein n=1 Tax=Actinomadura fulvescens TaxID=46160 RepID=A0ABN3QBJ3_9ACTN